MEATPQLPLPRETFLRWTAMARRMGMAVEDLLAAIAGNTALLDHIAVTLSSPAVDAPAGDTRVSPPTPVYHDPAKIEILGRTVRAWLPQRVEAFVDVVYPLGYRWTGAAWQQAFSQWQQPVTDRAVELAVLLLNAGFIVQPPPDLAGRIEAGDYTPLPTCWVKRRVKGRCTDWFEITWPEGGPDFYRKAALIRGAKVFPNVALVPRRLYDEVLDFAVANGFAVSNGALDLVAIAKAEQDATLFACPSTSKPKRPTKSEPAAPPVTPEGILDELADEPL